MIGAINRFNVALLQSTIENNKTLVITYSKINLACSMLFPDTIIRVFTTCTYFMRKFKLNEISTKHFFAFRSTIVSDSSVFDSLYDK